MEKMQKVIEESGISKRLFVAIKSTFKHHRSTVLEGTRYFNVNTGIRQGSVSLSQFIIYLNHVMLKIDQEDSKVKRCRL